ncbi:hypothetical protein ABZ078_10070 [Streptomyces sp. NPDC006385]|uniref:hypothetical protein n=1 Tax=Streptomyces sp. NPDC006385 TaxID=3156761 RepID=UPI0033A62CD4
MSKRRLKNKKTRIVAIGAAITSGAAVAGVLLPSANAADEKTPEDIMRMCQRARVLNGKQQSIEDFGGHPVAGPGFEADSCTFIPEPLEFFDGPTEKITTDFPNCPPDLDPATRADATWTTSVTQGQGKYTVTQQGGGGGLFGALNAAWLRHEGTMDLTLESASISEKVDKPVPEGKVLHLEFTPRMQRMKGVWRVKIEAREQGTVLPAQPEETYEAAEVVEGPVVRPGAAGAPGVPDGLIDPKLTDC